MKLRNLFIIVLALAACAVQVRATSVWINGQEQSTGGGSSGSSTLTNGQVQATNIAPDSIGPAQTTAQMQYVTNSAGLAVSVPTGTNQWFKVATLASGSVGNPTYIRVHWNQGTFNDMRMVIETWRKESSNPNPQFGLISFSSRETWGCGAVGSDGSGGIYVSITNASGASVEGVITSAGYCPASPDARPTLVVTSNSVSDVNSELFYLTPGYERIYAPSVFVGGDATLATGTVNAAQGAFSTSLTLGGSNVMTSAGGGGVNTNVFPQGIFIGPNAEWQTLYTSDGVGDNNYEIRATNGNDTDIEFRMPACSDASNSSAIAIWMNNSGDTNHHGAFGLHEGRGLTGDLSNGFNIVSAQIGTGKVWNIEVMVDNGVQNAPLLVAGFSTNGYMYAPGGLAISTNIYKNRMSGRALWIEPTADLPSPELGMYFNADGFVKYGFRDRADTSYGSLGRFGPSFAGIFSNSCLLQVEEGGWFGVRLGEVGGGNYRLPLVVRPGDFVGINVTNPVNSLDVAGSIMATVGYKVNANAGITTTQTFLDASSVIKTNIFIGGILVSGP